MLQKTKKREKKQVIKKKNKITPIAKQRLQQKKKKGQNQHGKKYKWKFLQLEKYCLNKYSIDGVNRRMKEKEKNLSGGRDHETTQQVRVPVGQD